MVHRARRSSRAPSRPRWTEHFPQTSSRTLSNTQLWVGYTYERFISSDWLNAIPATIYGNALHSGDANPGYSAHVIGAAVRYKW